MGRGWGGWNISAYFASVNKREIGTRTQQYCACHAYVVLRGLSLGGKVLAFILALISQVKCRLNPFVTRPIPCRSGFALNPPFNRCHNN